MAKTVLITGAAKRIGRAISLTLAKAGWNIAVHYNQSEKEAADLVEELKTANIQSHAFCADLNNSEHVKTLFRSANEKLGPITALVNNASLFERDTLADLDKSLYDAHMNVNLLAPVLLTQALSAQDIDWSQFDANIVNIIDQRVLNLRPNFTSYTLSKAALWTFTQTSAMELAPKIRVNAIGPGPTLASKRQSSAQFAHQVSQVPLGKSANADDIAAGVQFLMSSPSITGEFIAMDGGQHLPSSISTEEE